MYKIDMKKLLMLLIAFVAYVNYQNYIKSDIKKRHRETINHKTNINREIAIREHNYSKEDLLLDYSKITFNAKDFSYSKAMGEMQNHIYDAAKNVCKIQSVKWAQVPNTKLWYDKLRMNIRLTCKPEKLFEFTNRLKDKEIIYNVENFRAVNVKKKSHLFIMVQLVGFRTHNEVK